MAEDEDELVEVARANDSLEASVWARHLNDLGIQVNAEKRGGWLRALLFLGRVPVAVQVPQRDHARALEYLKRYRFI